MCFNQISFKLNSVPYKSYCYNFQTVLVVRGNSALYFISSPPSTKAHYRPIYRPCPESFGSLRRREVFSFSNTRIYPVTNKQTSGKWSINRRHEFVHHFFVVFSHPAVLNCTHAACARWERIRR